MSAFSDAKEKLNQTVHDHMHYVCDYYSYAPPGYLYQGELKIRVHREGSMPLFARAMGDSYAGKSEEEVTLILPTSEYEYKRGDALIISETEGYRIDYVSPDRVSYYSCEVERLSNLEITEITA